MPAYALATFTITDRSWVRDYVKNAADIVARHGGRYLAKSTDHEMVEGERRPELVVLLEFPTMEALHAFYDDPDYRPHRDARIAGTEGSFLLVPPAAG